MFCNSFLLYAILGTLYSTVLASPAPLVRDDHGTIRILADAAHDYPKLLPLDRGNAKFRQRIANSKHPDHLQQLTVDGQHPGYLFLGCSDSRVSEGTIFSPPPGVLFTERNIANQYSAGDLNAISIIAYGVTGLKVNDIVVMGHYGCGGVQASILDKPNNLDHAGEAVHAWIDPIRSLYHNSTRDEIIKLRDYRAANPQAEPPKFDDPGFRALVEENVKNTVSRIAQGPVMTDHWQAFLEEQNNREHKARAGGSDAPLKPVYVHGLVYDISTGQIYDLNISQGPPGYQGSH